MIRPIKNNKTIANFKFAKRRRVKPKKGRILLFNGDTLHTSSHPTKSDYRMCINIDYHD